jgi:GNAT superfamily N-acetyltransferase
MSAIRLSVQENVLSDPSRITLQMYEDYLDLQGRGWVAEVDGVIAAFSYADREHGSIWALFVSPEHEGRGLGKGLLELATSWLFGLGHERVLLSTTPGTRADRFYAAQGWARLAGEHAGRGNEVGYVLDNPRSDHP